MFFNGTLMKSGLLITGVWAALVGGLMSGCASGGYKITRQYSGWVNKQNIILRIVLYILTGIVYAVTLLIDAVIFNTMDFWQGRVSQGTYEFSKDEKTYVATHKIHSESGLKESRIVITGKGLAKSQEVVLRETAQSEIEVFIDGMLKGKVTDITAIPMLSLYDTSGKKVETRPLWAQEYVAKVQ